jgi:site-specific DNA-methyltransferase (adenine-specific)
VDYGIDGIKKENKISIPIQVKRSDNIGRNVIDNFKSAIARYYKSINKKIETNTIAGYIIAFSFSKGAVEEVARLKREENIVINLIKVEEIIPIAKKPKIEIGYEWEEVEAKTGSLSKQTDKKITFKIKTIDDSKIELYQWDFNYNKEKGFKADIFMDKAGMQERIFESGSYDIATKAIDSDGLECIEELRIIVNGGVKGLKNEHISI